MSSSTTRSASSCNVQRALPSGGVLQARAMSLASASPSNNRGVAGTERFLRDSAAENPCSTSRLLPSYTVFSAALQHRCYGGCRLPANGRITVQQYLRMTNPKRAATTLFDDIFQLRPFCRA